MLMRISSTTIIGAEGVDYNENALNNKKEAIVIITQGVKSYLSNLESRATDFDKGIASVCAALAPP